MRFKNIKTNNILQNLSDKGHFLPVIEKNNSRNNTNSNY